MESTLKLGYIDNNLIASLPIEDITHELLVGSSGYGKTESLKLQFKDCVIKDIGCIVIDPHGGLARDCAAIMASEGKTDFIYVAPRLSMELERVTKINPLQIDGELVNVFIDQLKHIYTNSWGDRLEAVLRNALLALLSLGSEYRNLDTLRRFIVDQRFRLGLLPKIPDKNIRSFFLDVYETKYSKDAGGAAYNKLDRLLSNPLTRAVFDITDQEKVMDFSNIIQENKKVVVDLSSIDKSSASFIGAIVLMMIFSSVRRMGERIESNERPFFIFIDECQYFAPVLRELLNMFRKFNIKLVLATQSLDEKQLPFAKEIIELTSTIGAFRIGRDSARQLRDILPLPEESLVSLEPYKFAVYSRGNPPKKGIFKTKKIEFLSQYDTSTKEGRNNVDTLIKDNIMKHGVEISAEKYVPVQREVKIKLPFNEYAVLVFLFKNARTYERQRMYEDLSKQIEVEPNEVRKAMYVLNSMYYVQFQEEIVSLTDIAIAEFFSDIPSGQRGGSDRHVDIMRQIAEYNRNQYYYVISDTGDTNKPKADIMVIKYRKGETVTWDYDDVDVFEVETNPSAHPEQVLKNFRKNYGKGYNVNFVVFNEFDRHFIYENLEKEGIHSEQFRVWLKEELPKNNVISEPRVEDRQWEVKGTVEIPSSVYPEPDTKQLLKKIKKNPEDREVIEELQKKGFTVTVAEDYVRIRGNNEDHKYKRKH